MVCNQEGKNEKGESGERVKKGKKWEKGGTQQKEG